MSLETIILSALGNLTVFKGLAFVAISEISVIVLKITMLAFRDG
jgi:hypothetical protein